MLFRRPKLPTRADHWRELAERLELLDASDAERRLRNLLNLESKAVFGPIYSLRLDDNRNLFFFEYHESRIRPLGTLSQTVSGCLISSAKRLSNVALKASRKLNSVLESLGASAIGGQLVKLEDDPGFSAQVTVYARDPQAALAILSIPVRERLLRALCEREATPTFLLGERHLLLSNRSLSDKPTDLAVLEALSSDLLSLHAALSLSEPR